MRFEKPHDLSLVQSFLGDPRESYFLSAVKAVVRWPRPELWPLLERIHEEQCLRLASFISPPAGSRSPGEVIVSETQIARTLERFFATHEALSAFASKATSSFDRSYEALCAALSSTRPRILTATLRAFLRVIPVSEPFVPLLFRLWEEHEVLSVEALKFLLDGSGKARKADHERWLAFLMGTHLRLGADSAVQILRQSSDALILIQQQIETTRSRSAHILCDVSNSAWRLGGGLAESTTFRHAMSAVVQELPCEEACRVLEHFVRNASCHDAAAVCEFAPQTSRPTKGLVDALLEQASHWNFYVHDPARMALLCMNDSVVDSQLEGILGKPISSLSIYSLFQTGCSRHWKVLV